MKKIYLTKTDFPTSVAEMLREKYELVFCDHCPCIRSPSFFEDIKGSHAILCTEKDMISRKFLDAAGPQLQIISTASITYDHIDIKECNKRGILVTNVANIGAETVAEYTIGLLLGVGRKIIQSSEKVMRTKWKELMLKACRTQGLVNSNIGFYGMERIAVEILKRIRSFQVAICLYHNIYRNEEAEQLGATYLNFEDLLKQSDFLIVSSILNDSNKKIFNSSAFTIMRSHAVLICIGSEDLLDLDDVDHALKNYVISAAGMEIILPDPSIYGRFRGIHNIVLNPRIENDEIETITEQANLAAQNIISFLEEEKALTVSEDKSFSPPSNLLGPLIVLEHAVRQKYFIKMTKDVLQLFLSRPIKAVDACGKIKHSLMQTLYQF